MLFLQDVILGMFMAALPIFSGNSSEKSNSFTNLPGKNAVHLLLHGAFGGRNFFLYFQIAFIFF